MRYLLICFLLFISLALSAQQLYCKQYSVTLIDNTLLIQDKDCYISPLKISHGRSIFKIRTNKSHYVLSILHQYKSVFQLRTVNITTIAVMDNQLYVIKEIHREQDNSYYFTMKPIQFNRLSDDILGRPALDASSVPICGGK